MGPVRTGERTARLRRGVDVRGVVQGVGFRPHVYALARQCGLAGTVRNTGDGVAIEVEGDAASVEEFCDRLGPEAPPLALVTRVTWTDLRLVGGTAFTIEGSLAGPGRTFVSADVGICEDCLDDLLDPADRRHRHPFVTCTNCGPRFTITTALPYDRPGTTMAGFSMCERCAAEYADPGDRRFHAQTICCPGCGPRVAFVGGDDVSPTGEDALAAGRRLLADGGVLAVKGIGGYHLACDAMNEAAVHTLRERKQRGDKPFAVMVRDLAAARRLAGLTEADERLLTSPARPVVLVRQRPEGRAAASVAPGLDELGVLLAYTPIHHLLLGLPGDPPGPQVLVMTSGNRAGEPIVTDDADARRRLAPLVDGWLTHDRPIHVPCDDSVTRVLAGREAPVRRSRGHAPLPIDLPFDSPPALATGGDLKNTLCLADGRLAWLSGHIGDMDDLATLAAFDAAGHHLEELTGVRPVAVATDRHPGYRSVRWARNHAHGRPLVTVQHHHAHVAATMAEHGLDAGARVLGVAFDGTGYGDDGAVWGGEILVASYAGFARAGHLAYVPLPGGDAGVRNPCRMALSHLRAAGVDWNEQLPSVAACTSEELRLLERQLAIGLGCAPTSSMGRLFDAVASLVGVCHRAGYDAQAAMELESLAARAGPVRGYSFGISVAADVLDPAPVIAAVAADVLRGVDPEVVAARFHRGVVDLVSTVALALREATGLATVTLSGGVFLNALLTTGCAEELSGHGLEVLVHHKVPASDAGIALGQVAVLAHDPVVHSLIDRRPRPSEVESSCV